MTTWDPNKKPANVTLSNGNLTATANSTTSDQSVIGDVGLSSGKWYFELRVTNRSIGGANGVGICGANTGKDDKAGMTADSWAWLSSLYVYHDSTQGTYLGGWAANVTYMVAVDLNAGKLWFGRDGGWYASGDPANGTNPAASDADIANRTVYPIYTLNNANNSGTARFDSDDLQYSAPTGFNAGWYETGATTRLEDVSLNLAAYFQELADLGLSLAAQGYDLQDIKTDLSAYYQGLDDIKTRLAVWGYDIKDLPLLLSALAQGLNDLPTSLSAAAQDLLNIKTCLQAVDGLVLADLSLFLSATDGTVLKDLPVRLSAIKATPAFMATVAQRLTSVITEVT